MKNALLLPFLNWARKLRYPTLFKLTAVLFAVSVLLPPGRSSTMPSPGWRVSGRPQMSV